MTMMRKISGFLLAASFLTLVCLTSASCSHHVYGSTNNDRSLPELVAYMTKQVGGNVSGGMVAAAVKAEDGVSLRVADRDVAFYKYNVVRKKQRAKLEQIKKSGLLYIAGIPFEAVVNGSFVMIDHDKNQKKDELVKAFKNF